jgi:hypothetical protein
MNINILYGILIVVILKLVFTKENFNVVTDTQLNEDNYYRNYKIQHDDSRITNNQVLTKLDLENLVSSLVKYSNGSPKGANVTLDQNKYDLIFKDILVSSDKRNITRYPNPNEYSIYLNTTFNKIYKAELIEVYIPAATDDSVNIPTTANRLYFEYSHGGISTSGYIVIQAGTYLSPESIATELTRQFTIILKSAGFTIDKNLGLCVVYDKNLNRYIIKDKDYNAALPTFRIFPKNGYQYTNLGYVVENSITELMMIDSQVDYIEGAARYINTDQYGNLVVTLAQPGDFGQFSPGMDVPTDRDSLFSNCILSNVVLTDCKIFLSLGKLNGTTCNLIQNESGSNKELPDVFCQIPNNTCTSSASVKTLLNQPASYSSIQFYNPPLSKINKLEIKWYQESGELIRILDHCFTVRLYYFQKRIGTTDFSYPIP